jgi:hypothetical protein
VIAGLASIVPAKRSAEDIFAGRVRVELGAKTYTMPVRSRKANREWLESLDALTGHALDALDTIDDAQTVLRVLARMDEEFVRALKDYDETNALPDEIDDIATDMQLYRAIQEVWLAANPKVAIALGLVDGSAPTPSQTSSPMPPDPSGGPLVSSNAS